MKITWLLCSFMFYSAVSSGQQLPNLINILSDTFYQIQNNTDRTNLVGTRWVLQYFKGHELLLGTIMTLDFFDAKNISGSDGCNIYGIEYSIHPKNTFTINGGSRNQAGCTASESSQADEYVKYLSIATNYKIEGALLSFSNKHGEDILRYKLLPKLKPNYKSLFKKTWQLVSITGFEGFEPTAFTLQFDERLPYDENGKAGEISLYGTTSCRTHKSTYRIKDDILSISSTQKSSDFLDFFCSTEDLTTRDNYIELLKNIWRYSISPTQLEFFSDHGRKLVFELATQK